jgi:multiple sugar transport system ATP-binding protein
MNFIPGRLTGGQLETPFGTHPVKSERMQRVGDRDLAILGIRPQDFEDSSILSDDKRQQGVTFKPTVDVTEWLGNELYAYVPYEAPAEITQQLRELERELDSESLRTQLIVSLDPASTIRSGSKAELWFDTERVHVFDPKTGENLTRNPDRTSGNDQPASVDAAGPPGEAGSG